MEDKTRVQVNSHVAESEIRFTLNGRPVLVQAPAPTDLLVDYLRGPETDLTGTKLSCGEGGCGACSVLLTRRDPASGGIAGNVINACLRPLCSIDGMAVTTIEGLGSCRTGLNPIQQRIIDCNGSQCGYCTPGFVMSMYGLLRNNSSPTAQDIENQFDGNICRCTGFRAILDAMQSFATDADAAHLAACEPPGTQDPEEPRRLHIRRHGYEYLRVMSVNEILKALKSYNATQATVKLVNGNTSIGIYKRDVYDPHVLIDISQVAELQRCEAHADGVTIGAGASYATILEFLDKAIGRYDEAQSRGLNGLRTHINRIAGHQVRAAGTPAGNIMMVLQRSDGKSIPFPSDLFTVLAGLDATVTVISPSNRKPKVYPILAFPSLESFPQGCVLVSIQIPLTEDHEYFESYKVARRPQNSHAIVNAAFRVLFGKDGRVKRSRLVLGGIGSTALAAVDTQQLLEGQPWSGELLKRALACLEAETSARIIPIPDDTISAEYRVSLAVALFYKFYVSVAGTVASWEVEPEVAEAGRPYQRAISSGSRGFLDAPFNDGQPPAVNFAAPALDRLSMATSSAMVPTLIMPAASPAAATAAATPMPPVGIGKIGADLQTTGEAKYTQDLSSIPHPLACSYVYSAKVLANFSYAKPLSQFIGDVKAKYPGFVAYITAIDIPNKRSADIYNPADPGSYDPIFATDIVTAYGQPIGLVVADDALVAERAATELQSNIVYTSDGLTPILTIDEAFAVNSFLTGHGSINSVTRPGSDAQWLLAPYAEDGKAFVTGVQKTGAQAHFYMETQATLAVPGEHGAMTLYTSAQHLSTCQEWVADVLGIPTNKVEVRAARLGGGFGGKEVRPPYFAAAAAVAAWVVNRPVRLALDRNTDMIMVGKRHPFVGHYALSADDSGKIEKAKYSFIADAGFSYDCTLPVTDLVLLSADSAYSIPTFEAERTACRTNLASNTAMRSFGVIQQTLIVEDAMEQLAHELGISPEIVRERNFYRDATLSDFDKTPYGQDLNTCRINQVWNDFKKKIDFDTRAAGVQDFNAANRWRKRGIAMIPVKYGISYTYMPMNYGSAAVSVYSNDGTILLKHGGVEMGQGIHTKIAYLAAQALNIDMSLIRIADTDTDDIANAVSTGASTGTDLNGGAALQACQELRKRLEDFCAAHDPPLPLWTQTTTGNWVAAIKAANKSRISLAAQALYSSPCLAPLSDKNGQLPPDKRMFYYFTYSAAASEVEIDVLTGEATIVRSDIVYDSGKSVNSTLDFGQIEGGFVQGVGNVMTEQIVFSDEGRLVTDSTWNYKPPCSKSIPIEFNVSMLRYVYEPGSHTPMEHYGVQSSKSTGEPPLVLASSVFFAIKRAILAARSDAGVSEWFELDSPATVERVQQACLVDIGRLVLGD